MWNPKTDKKLNAAILTYLYKNGLTMDNNAEYLPGIDHVCIRVDGKPVLRVGLPPVSNYSIRETEYTNKYLRLDNVRVV